MRVTTSPARRARYSNSAYSFAVSDVQYVLTFLIMLAVGLITGQLTAGLRFQARVAGHREERADSLYALSRDLSAAATTLTGGGRLGCLVGWWGRDRRRSTDREREQTDGVTHESSP